MKQINVQEFLNAKTFELNKEVELCLVDLDKYIKDRVESQCKSSLLTQLIKLCPDVFNYYKELYKLKLEINGLNKLLLNYESLEDTSLDLLKEINSLIYEKKFNFNKKVLSLLNIIKSLTKNLQLLLDFEMLLNKTDIEIILIWYNFIGFDFIEKYHLSFDATSDLGGKLVLNNSYEDDLESPIILFRDNIKSILDHNLINSLKKGWYNIWSKKEQYNRNIKGIQSIKKTEWSTDYIYLVNFNKILKKDMDGNVSETLVYSYYSYHRIFTYSLVNYLEEVAMNNIKELNVNNTVFILEDVFSNNSNWNELCFNQFLKTNLNYLDKKKGISLSFIEMILWFSNGSNYFNLNLMVKLINWLFAYELQNVGDLFIKLHFTSKPFISDFYQKGGFNLKPNTDFSKNILFNFCFLVKDLDSLLSNLKHLNVNGGPQKDRAKCSYLDANLARIDSGYRKSMYIHNLNNGCGLKAKDFSFKNIHMNLGNVRWYSTKSVKLNKPFQGRFVSDNKSLKINSPIFNMLRDLLVKNPINNDTQIKIEEFLLNSSHVEDENFNNIYSVNKDLATILVEEKKNFYTLIKNFKKSANIDSLGSSSLNQKDQCRVIFFQMLNLINTDFVFNITFGRLLKIIWFYSFPVNKDISLVNIACDLGSELVNKYKYLKYLEWKETTKTDGKIGCDSFSTWSSENNNLFSNLDSDDNSFFVFSIGSFLLDYLFTLDLLKIKTINHEDKEKINVLVPSKRLKNILEKDSTKNILFTLPKKIPMIVKPKLYKHVDGELNLGGYLLNDVKVNDVLIKKSWVSKIGSKILVNNKIYDLINNISTIPYQINTQLLSFILYDRPDLFKDEIINENHYKHYMDKDKLSLKEKRELDSILSKKELQENILGLASVFSTVPELYFPVKLDYRGRLYCIPEYLNYQSSDLAKSLLLFSKGEFINVLDNNAVSFLKIFGANCFGLDKLSFNDRVKWVDDNLTDIINFSTNDIISKAENKFLFTAFCMEFSRFIACKDSYESKQFKTFLPIQMDATCNGFQHLSLLSSDNNLAKELNLTESNWSDKPKDFYTFLLINLIDYFKMGLLQNNFESEEVKESYIRLIDIDLQRKLIKKSIMTIPYNVSNLQLISYIKENFTYSDGWYYYGDIKLKNIDFKHLGYGLKSVLWDKFPKLNSLLKYLEDAAKICCLLQIPIPWTLPSGVEIKQSYLETKSVRLKPFTHQKNTFVLKVKNMDSFNKAKQIRSFMPNLIHSLDATSLTLLVDLYFKSNKNPNIYTIHDCFAVTANNVQNISDLLKLVYTEIYSNNDYLLKLDSDIKNSIKTHFGDDSISEDLSINPAIYDDVSKKPYYFPNIKSVVSKDINFESLQKSSYSLN